MNMKQLRRTVCDPTEKSTVKSRCAYLEVNNGVRAKALAGLEDEVALQVAGVESGERKTVAVASQRNSGRGALRGLWGSRVHVVEEQVRLAASDAAAQVGHLRTKSQIKSGLYFY